MKKVILFLVTAVVFVGVGCGGYFLWKNYNEEKETQKETSKPKETTKKEGKVWTNQELETILAPFFKQVGNGDGRISDFSDERIFSISLSMIMVDLGKENYGITIGEYNGEHDVMTVPLESIQKVAKAYFNKTDFMYSGDKTFNYDANEKVYRNHGGMGFGALGPVMTYKITDSKRNENKYTVTLEGTYTKEEKEMLPSLHDKTLIVETVCNENSCYAESWKVK